MITLDEAKQFVNPAGVNPGNATDQDDAYISQCLAEAEELVDAFTAGEDIPVISKNKAKLLTLSALYHQRNAPNGIQQFADFGGAVNVVRVARDPMIAAYPILARFMVIGL